MSRDSGDGYFAADDVTRLTKSAAASAGLQFVDFRNHSFLLRIRAVTRKWTIAGKKRKRPL